MAALREMVKIIAGAMNNALFFRLSSYLTISDKGERPC
jgi:hypothetical protein